ncbi:MAG: DNA-binding response regulator [Chitinophagaceae bacterium]|nr:DNA-binding response regulator [Chitinophagaceae bacterium]
MKKINCIIADDEMLAREVIENHISKLDNLNLVGACATGIEAYSMLNKQAVDLLFLDINMPQLTGLALLKTLKDPPAVILTTAYREFALDGYELGVIDYLLKPIAFERFLKAIDKYINVSGLKLFPALGEQFPLNQEDKPDFIYIKFNKKMVRILLEDIIYLEGLKDYVKVHTPTETIITYQTLTHFTEKLPVDAFMRVHRSYIVSLRHITAYSSSLIEIGKVEIPIGGVYAKAVMTLLHKGD